MSQREMEAILKALDALACAACVFVCALVIPGVESEGSVPAGSVPCFAVGIAPLLALGAVSWGLFSAIGRGETFVQSNAHRLRTMGYLAAADAVVWLPPPPPSSHMRSSHPVCGSRWSRHSAWL